MKKDWTKTHGRKRVGKCRKEENGNFKSQNEKSREKQVEKKNTWKDSRYNTVLNLENAESPCN